MAWEAASVALLGKLLPQTVLFSLWFILCDVVFYQFMNFPCNCPFWHIIILGLLFTATLFYRRQLRTALRQSWPAE